MNIARLVLTIWLLVCSQPAMREDDLILCNFAFGVEFVSNCNILKG